MNDLQKVNIDVSKVPSSFCECGGKYFQSLFELKRVPEFLSPTGRAGYITIQRFKCDNCGKIFDNEATNRKIRQKG